ncbi:MAG TPA: GNAT family N-acetyltransferase, partial [Candidatus Omnitrophota bacterium]|nr:GNAT family N-acetyltransferase [Candidatus Omnitrophota bacterium]
MWPIFIVITIIASLIGLVFVISCVMDIVRMFIREWIDMFNSLGFRMSVINYGIIAFAFLRQNDYSKGSFSDDEFEFVVEEHTRVDSPFLCFYVLTKEKEQIGYSILDLDTGLRHSLWVKGEYRQHGLATKLLMMALQEGARRQIPVVKWKTKSSNTYSFKASMKAIQESSYEIVSIESFPERIINGDGDVKEDAILHVEARLKEKAHSSIKSKWPETIRQWKDLLKTYGVPESSLSGAEKIVESLFYFASKENLNKEEIGILKIAAWLHDISRYQSKRLYIPKSRYWSVLLKLLIHHLESADVTENLLKEHKFEENFIHQVCGIIRSHMGTIKGDIHYGNKEDGFDVGFLESLRLDHLEHLRIGVRSSFYEKKDRKNDLMAYLDILEYGFQKPQTRLEQIFSDMILLYETAYEISTAVYFYQHHRDYYLDDAPEPLYKSFNRAMNRAEEIGLNLYTELAKDIYQGLMEMLNGFEDYINKIHVIDFLAKEYSQEKRIELFSRFYFSYMREYAQRGSSVASEYLRCLLKSKQEELLKKEHVYENQGHEDGRLASKTKRHYQERKEQKRHREETDDVSFYCVLWPAALLFAPLFAPEMINAFTTIRQQFFVWVSTFLHAPLVVNSFVLYPFLKYEFLSCFILGSLFISSSQKKINSKKLILMIQPLIRNLKYVFSSPSYGIFRMLKKYHVDVIEKAISYHKRVSVEEFNCFIDDNQQSAIRFYYLTKEIKGAPSRFIYIRMTKDRIKEIYFSSEYFVNVINHRDKIDKENILGFIIRYPIEYSTPELINNWIRAEKFYKGLGLVNKILGYPLTPVLRIIFQIKEIFTSFFKSSKTFLPFFIAMIFCSLVLSNPFPASILIIFSLMGTMIVYVQRQDPKVTPETLPQILKIMQEMNLIDDLEGKEIFGQAIVDWANEHDIFPSQVHYGRDYGREQYVERYDVMRKYWTLQETESFILAFAVSIGKYQTTKKWIENLEKSFRKNRGQRASRSSLIKNTFGKKTRTRVRTVDYLKEPLKWALGKIYLNQHPKFAFDLETIKDMKLKDLSIWPVDENGNLLVNLIEWMTQKEKSPPMEYYHADKVSLEWLMRISPTLARASTEKPQI